MQMLSEFVLLISMTILFNLQGLASDNSVFFEQLQSSRNNIYTTLQLTPKQRAMVKNLDNRLYQKLTSSTKNNNISYHVNEIQEFTNNTDYSIENIDALQSDFHNVEKRLSTITNEYETEFCKILTPKQKKIYKSIKLQ